MNRDEQIQKLQEIVSDHMAEPLSVKQAEAILDVVIDQLLAPTLHYYKISTPVEFDDDDLRHLLSLAESLADAKAPEADHILAIWDSVGGQDGDPNPADLGGKEDV